MLATHTSSLLLHLSPAPSPPPPCLLFGSRLALNDSTNVGSRPSACGSGSTKSLAFPTSSVRTGGCGWSDFESSAGSSSASSHARHHHLSAAPSPFLVTCKAPPTVSISLSEACSQSVPGQRSRSSRVQCPEEPDLPDVRSVVPFPSTPLEGDVDVDMLDGTCFPCLESRLPSAGQAPRKRRSAHSSVSSSQGNLGKETKQKRPRKSRRQVVELWWLAVVHRSILRIIEGRQSGGEELDSADGVRDLVSMDRMLVEKIQKRLSENGCVEGRSQLNPLPRITSPSMSVPSLDLSTTGTKTLPIDSVLPTPLSSELSSGEINGTTSFQAVSNRIPCTSLSTAPRFPTIPSISTSHRRHMRFDVAQRPRHSPPHPSIPRRSPSPPARTGTVSANTQNLTLTMPQLVASLMLAHHERNGLRVRGRNCKNTETGKNTGCSPSFVACRAGQGGNDVNVDRDAVPETGRMHAPCTSRSRPPLLLSSVPQKKSPLSRVAYAES